MSIHSLFLILFIYRRYSIRMSRGGLKGEATVYIGKSEASSPILE